MAAGVLVSDGKTGILIDPYVSRFGFLKIAIGLHLQPNKEAVKSWTARLGKGGDFSCTEERSIFPVKTPYIIAEFGLGNVHRQMVA